MHILTVTTNAHHQTPNTPPPKKNRWADLEPGAEDEGADVAIAGRIMARRVFGKLAFFTLQDSSGVIQLYIDKGRLEEEFNVRVERRALCVCTNATSSQALTLPRNPTKPTPRIQKLKQWTDAGDIIGVRGSVKRTEKGEMSVYVERWEMLTKSLLPLPDKWHGLTDVNKRYRQRETDMIVNPQVKETFKLRAKLFSGLRRLLDDKGFLEIEVGGWVWVRLIRPTDRWLSVRLSLSLTHWIAPLFSIQTPILQVHPGGADARPFKTYHNSLDMDLTLRIATELHLKRLVVGASVHAMPCCSARA